MFSLLENDYFNVANALLFLQVIFYKVGIIVLMGFISHSISKALCERFAKYRGPRGRPPVTTRKATKRNGKLLFMRMRQGPKKHRKRAPLRTIRKTLVSFKVGRFTLRQVRNLPDLGSPIG